MNNGNKKRIFISADIEGTAGAFLWEAGRKGTEEYNRQCRIMTEEVLAVVESLNEKYESCEIMIKDAHATGNNLDITAFPENCSIISGWDDGPYGMMQELDDSYDFAVLIGYHSGAGTGGAPLAHTLNSRKYSSVELNGVKISEFVLSYYTALMTGVPIALVSGDYALCQEIEVYDQSIYTVAVQEGRGGSVITRSPVYSGKIVNGALKYIKDQKLHQDDNVLIIHSGGTPGIFNNNMVRYRNDRSQIIDRWKNDTN